MGGRPQLPPVVAIDGPAGAGKSTVARAVAHRMGLTYLDTGALYRALGVAVADAGVDPDDAAAVAALCPRLSVRVESAVDGATRVFVNGVELTGRIRTPEAAHLASAVSRHPAVRAHLLGIQQAAAARGGVVLDGRDIGTVVLPDADVKIFLDASPEERARRRHAELAARGQAADYAETLAQVQARDAADTGRAVAPLTPAADAVRLDTSHLTADAVVARICGLVAAARSR